MSSFQCKSQGTRNKEQKVKNARNFDVIDDYLVPISCLLFMSHLPPPPKSQSSQTHSFWALCRSGSWSSSSCASGAWGQRSLKNQSKQFADRITTANARKTFRECSLVQVDACPSGRFALFSACTLLGAVGLQQLKEKNTHNTKSPHPISPLIRGPSRV